MTFNVMRTAVQAIALIVLPAVGAAAHTRHTGAVPAHMPLGSETTPPRGFVDMCASGERQDLCAPALPAGSTGTLVAPFVSGWGASGTISGKKQAFAPWCGSVPVRGVGNCSGGLSRLVRFDPEPVDAALRFPAPAPVAQALPNTVARAMLSRVNRYVNRRVRQMTDARVFGVGEVWRRSGVNPGARGDCEDIAIEKRLELITEGFPPDRLAFAVVFSRASGLHTVLIARTDDGDMVLDSRTATVESWTKVRYSWLSVQRMGDAMSWHRLDLRAAPEASV